MPKNKIILFCFLFSWIGLHPIAAISLEKQSTVGQKIRQAIQGKNATVGVAFSIDGQLFTFNDEHRYPLMSIFKLHVAIAALQKMENECIALDSLRFIESSQIHKDTYSPLCRFSKRQQRLRHSHRLSRRYRYRERPNRQIRYHKLQSHRNRRNHALSHIQLL